MRKSFAPDFSFWRSNLFSCERDVAAHSKSQFYLSFWRSSLRAKGMSRHTQNRNFTSAFGDRAFVRKGCRGTLKIAILPQFLAIEPHFVRKECRGTLKIAILPQFLAIEPHFVRKIVATQNRHTQNRNITSVFGDRASFRAKDCRSTLKIAIYINRNFTSVFGDRTSFRAKGLRFVPSRWPCLAP